MTTRNKNNTAQLSPGANGANGAEALR